MPTPDIFHYFRFNFSGRFDIELADNCDNDYIEIQFWNTSVNTWTRLGDRMCGRSLPDVLVSPSGRSRLVFRSNQVCFSFKYEYLQGVFKTLLVRMN